MVPVIGPGTAGVPGLTAIDMLLLVAVGGCKTHVAFEVRTTFTIAPLVKDVVV